MYGVSASHEGATRRCTHWHHIIIVKHHATVCQSINVRRRHLVRPMETYVVPTLQKHRDYPSKIPHKQTYIPASRADFSLTNLSYLNPRTHLKNTVFHYYHHYRNNNNNNLGTWFVSGDIQVNTLYKGDKDNTYSMEQSPS